MRVLVTGANGFVGRHLIDFLKRKSGIEIYGFTRKDALPSAVLGIHGDIRDKKRVLNVLRAVKPERIFHLAGQAHVGNSWSKSAETFETNALGALHLLDASRKLDQNPRILVVGSAEEYGEVCSRDLPIREDKKLSPASPYGWSKVVQENLAMQYHRSFGTKVICIRVFNQIGPGQSEAFAASHFARQIALAESGRAARCLLRVGYLGAVRDFIDIRDAVEAYWLALDRGSAGDVYNVCTGTGRSVRQLLDFLVAQSRVNVKIKQDTSRLRPWDPAVLVGDARRLRAKTGWKPRRAFETTLMDLLNDWRIRVGVSAAKKAN